MIKVLHICPALGSGGIEKLLFQWYKEAKKNDIQFVFAVYRLGGEAFDYFKKEGCNIYIIPQIRNSGVKRYRKEIRKIIEAERIDVVHTNAGPITWVALKEAYQLGVTQRIVHAHTNLYLMGNNKFFGRIILRVSRYLNKKYSTIAIACGMEAGEYCFGKNNFRWIKNGIDLDKFFYSGEAREAIRRKYQIPDDAKVIGFVGRLEEQKNPLFALKIVKEVQKIKSNIYFLVLGEGNLKNNMEKMITDDNIGNVIFAGNSSEIEKFYSAMDILLFPSLYEGLSIVTIEAQATGLPIITSDGVPKGIEVTDLVIWEKLASPSRKWADRIVKLLDPATRKSYIEEIRLAGYDMRETVNEMISIYKLKGEKNANS